MFEHLPLTLAQEDAAPAPILPGPGGVPLTVKPGGNGTGGDNTATDSPPPGLFGPQFMFIMLGAIALMMIFSSRSQSKERKKRAGMIAALKKGDRVQTVGGVIGAVVEVRESEVVLKVDENANTRIKFTRAAIQSVISEDKEELKEETKV